MFKPVYSILAGPNGVGKSTLARSLEKFAIILGPMINPDNIASSLGGKSGSSAIEAARYALKETRRHIRDGRDFSRETTLSSREILSSVRLAKNTGFRVRIIYLGADHLSETAARVAERAALGGHDIPYPIQKRRFSRSLGNAATAARLADETLFFSNAADEFIFHARFADSSLEILSTPLPDWLKKLQAALTLPT